MGQADRRGTFEERKAKAIEKNKKGTDEALENLKNKSLEFSPEDKKQQGRNRLAMMSMMATIKRSGLSTKEFTRRLKRYNKKGV